MTSKRVRSRGVMVYFHPREYENLARVAARMGMGNATLIRSIVISKLPNIRRKLPKPAPASESEPPPPPAAASA